MAARIKLQEPRNTNRVYDVGAPKVHGTVISNGDINCEVAEVRWDNPNPWGQRGFHIKRFLRIVGEDPIAGHEKVIFMSADHFAIMDLSHRVDKCKKFSDAKAIVLANKKKQLSIYAVTKKGTRTVVLRSLWPEFDKL